METYEEVLNLRGNKVSKESFSEEMKKYYDRIEQEKIKVDLL